MLSYWGVDHGSISKSYIPGKGWVSAGKAGKKSLRAASKRGNRYSGMRGVSASDATWKNDLGGTDIQARFWSQPKGSVKTRAGRVTRMESGIMPGNAQAYAYMSGRNRFIVTAPNAPDKIVRHEMAHVSPKKRTPYRLNQIKKDPKKTMREEARADMAGGMYWRDKTGTQLTGASGYQQAARKADSARNQRSSARSSKRRAKKFGDTTLDRNHQLNMFKQRTLSDYRGVQDKIARSQGRKQVVGTRAANAGFYTREVAPYASAAAITAGGGHYFTRDYKAAKKGQKQTVYKARQRYEKKLLTPQEKKSYVRGETASNAAYGGMISGLTAANVHQTVASAAGARPNYLKMLRLYGSVGALGAGTGAAAGYYAANKKKHKMVPVSGARS